MHNTHLILGGPSSPRGGRGSAPCVVDMDSSGDFVGVEVINLHWSAGVCPDAEAGEARRLSDDMAVGRWSYDRDADALYIRLTAGRVDRQRDGTCECAHTEGGLRVAIELADIEDVP